MENKPLLKRFLPHLLVAIGFLALAFIYAYPVIQGKMLVQSDILQHQASTTEAIEYQKRTGELTLWTNSIFSGMPAYMIHIEYPTSVTQRLGSFLYQALPLPVNLIFIYLLGFYIFLISLRCNIWLSILGAIAFTFGSYNFIIIEAGHVSKVLAVAYAPPIIAGVILAYRGRYFLGGALAGLFMGLELYSNHIQITYYVFIAILFLGIFELVNAIRQKRIKQFALATLILSGFVFLAVGTQAARLLTVYEYSQKTIRGQSELSDQTSGSVPRSSGLDREYAFNHSYSISETLTLLIPEIYGGASAGELSTSSDTYKTLVNNGVPAASANDFVKQLPLYWGDQPFTSGPAYAGAIICFLFIFTLIISRNPLKWWLLMVTVFFLMISWGKNLAWFNDFLFYNVPMFNKFRAITMVSSLIHLFMSAMVALGLKEIIEGRFTFEETKKALYTSAGVTGGIALIFAVAGGAFFNFTAAADTALQSNLTSMTGNEGFATQILSALRQDRASLLRTDAFRSFVFIALGAGLVYLYLRQKATQKVLLGGLILLILADLWFVNKRYFSSEDFVAKRLVENRIVPTEADRQILQDRDPHYRVLDVTRNTFNDNTTAKFHKSIGGYHAAKLRRYQDLIERQISRNNMQVLNMLNAKYFIVPGQNGQPTAQLNPNALGNAWFVNGYTLVDNADQEMAALDTLFTGEYAVIDKRFEDQLNNLRITSDLTATIKLVSYEPNKLVYKTDAAHPQLAVFSEIYYNDFNNWEVTIDGKPADHFRVNYVLRAMVVPEGKHTIEFKFAPHTYQRGKTIDLVASILLVLALGFAFYRASKVEKQE
jgi:hypothetical protein